MFKLGEYDEIEAEDIAEYLRDAGIRVDVRTSINAFRESSTFIVGKLSELKEADPETFEDYEKCLETLNKVLDEGVSQEDFINRFLSTLDPSWKKEKDMMTNLINNGGNIDIFVDEDHEDDEDDEDLFDEDFSDDEDDDFLGTNEHLLGKLFEYIRGVGFAQLVLDLNEIELEEGVKKSLGDDPLLQFPIDPEEFDEDDPRMKSVLAVFFDKAYDIYIDEMTAPLIDDVDEMFSDDYPQEFINIQALGMLIDKLFEPPEGSKKIDFEDFEDLCTFEVGEGSHTMKVDATSVAEELSKVLEKNGVIRARGGKVKWKKLRS